MRSAVNIGRAAQPRTYSEWFTHAAELSNNIARTWNADGRSIGSFYVNALSAANGSMQGSSWGGAGGSPNGFPNVATQVLARIVQHGMPSETVFNDQMANTRRIFCQIASGVTASDLPAVTRNGFTSTVSTGMVATRRLVLMRYWYAGQVWEIDPSVGGSPTPYNW